MNHRALPMHSMLATMVSVLLLMAASTGCERNEPVTPPRIHFGQDVCDVCHMIISDDRYAAAIVTDDEYGRRTRLVFDDIGCVFEFEAQLPARLIERIYVRDYMSRQWIDASEATMVHSRDLHTPMAFGLASLREEQSAAAVHGEFGGDIINLTEARQRFEQGILHVERVSLDSDIDAERSDDTAVDPARLVELADGRRLQVDVQLPTIIGPGQHPFEVKLLRWFECGHWMPAEDTFVLQIVPEMPSMGHGSPGNRHPELVGEGLYRGSVNFTMRGSWVVHVTVLENDAAAGTVSLNFEVQK